MLSASLPTLPRKRSPMQVQRAVLVALVIRELRSRVQGRWLGLLWMVFEPLAHILVILALVGFRRHVVTINIEYPVYLVTGLLPFFMFRNLARRLPQAVAASRGLYAYRQVKPVDTMLARAIVEVGLYSGVYLAALALLGWSGMNWLPFEPLQLMAVSTVLLLLGFGLGLFFSVLSHNRPKVDAVIGMLFMPLYFLSGVVFPLTSMSADVRSWLLWNPVLHLIELNREHFMPHLEPMRGVSLAYPVGFTLVVLALGMASYRVYRHRLVVAE